jgi:hypothetical protein
MALRKKLRRNKKKSEHHRKPTSIKGYDSPVNVKLIAHDIHMEWHTLVANKCAPKIAVLLAKPFEARRYRIECRRMPRTVHKLECPSVAPCINTVATKRNDYPQCAFTEWTSRHQRSLERLEELISKETGERPTPLRTIRYFNEHLLDPDYRLVLSFLKK